MKRLFNGASQRNRNLFAKISWLATIIIISMIIPSCQKEVSNAPSQQDAAINSHAANSQGNVLTNYTDLPSSTLWELQQARAATAKYQDIDNAIKDGYADIEVDVQHMGHHFMKTSIVDGVFDIKQPEILVYNRDNNGKQVLVAVEYAVPLSYPQPEGFTGSADIWNGASGFPLWLLHAWVWAYNPDGVFNWTNPDIELN